MLGERIARGFISFISVSIAAAVFLAIGGASFLRMLPPRVAAIRFHPVAVVSAAPVIPVRAGLPGNDTRAARVYVPKPRPGRSALAPVAAALSAPVSAIQAYAERKVGAAQFSCLKLLWDQESGWRWNAENPYSGAYGIPQSLPASKMASAGADYMTDPYTQIRWGLSYIAERYGTPCGAWANEERFGSY